MRPAYWLFVPIVAAALACAACAAAPAAPATSADVPTIVLNSHRFTVEIADTPPARAHGLMDRTEMPADHGMLFIFPDSEPRTFWMKDTLIPLDILFFDEAQRLVSVQEDVPQCRSDPCPVYPSIAPARYVLELNAGVAAKLGVRRGDVITFSDLPSGTQ
ncbi:MAG: DUF192 domain-containing protein [Rhodanobacteraceae bacterium]